MPTNKTKIKIIIQEIKKLTNPLVTTDIGNISRGKYTFLIKLLLFVMQVVPWDITVVKKFQGMIPQIKKIK